MPTKIVLSIGQCGYDDSRLSQLVQAAGATLQRAADPASARALINHDISLLLINRVFDDTGDSGIAFLASLRADNITTPAILVSDYPQAQAQALAAGALPGFGKSQLSDPSLITRLRKLLSP